MSVSVSINSVTTRVKDVPFGVAVSLLNATLSGVTSQKWEIVAYSNDIYGNEPDPVNYSGWTQTGKIFSRTQSGSFPAVTFVPDISGNYIVRLTDTSNGDPSLWTVQTAVVRIKDQLSGGYIPAPGENDEADTDRGWALERNQDLRLQARAAAYGTHIRVVNLTGSTLARGKIVKVLGMTDMHTVGGSAVPAGTSVRRERVARVQLGNSNDSDAVGATYAVVVEPAGIPNNGSGYALKSGLFEGVNPSSGAIDINFSGFAVNTSVYLTTTGSLASVPTGSNSVAVGHCIEAGSDGDMLFDGGLGIGLATTSVPGLESTDDKLRTVDSIVDGIATGTLQLASLVITNLPNNFTSYVRTVRDTFVLDKTSTATADGISVVTASGGTGRWFRQLIADPFWTLRATWTIDPGAGSDESDGSTALKTFAEFDRRLGTNNITQSVVITALADVPVTDRPAFRCTTTGSGIICVAGTITQLGTGTVTALTAQNKATNQPAVITDSAIPTSWTSSGYVKKLIRFYAGASLVGTSWTAIDLGTKQCQISSIVLNSEVPGNLNNSAGTVSSGNTYKVFSFIKVPGPTIRSANLLIRYWCVQVDDSNSGASISVIGNQQVRWTPIDCIMNGVYSPDPSTGRYSFNHICLLAGVQGSAGAFGNLTNCLAYSAVAIGDPNQTIVGDLMLVSGGLSFTRGVHGPICDIGVFNVTSGPMITLGQTTSVQVPTRVSIRGFIWGSGNTGVVFYLSIADAWVMLVNIPTVATSSTPKIQFVDNTTYVFADIPVQDLVIENAVMVSP